MAGNIFAGYSKSPIHPNLSSSAGGNTAQGTGSTHHKPKQQKPKQGKPHKPAKPKTPNPMGRGPLNALNYDAPLDYPTAVKLSQALGGLQYDSQIGQLKGIRSNIPTYFDQYRSALQNAQTQTNQLSQPLLTQAGQVAQNTGQTLGLSGPAAGNDALAAASRAQQAGAMAQALQGIADANSNYYGQTGANSYGAQTTADQQLGQQIAGLKGERGNAILSNLLNLRNTDRNYNLEVKTLLGNQAQDRAQARNTRASIKAGVTKAKISAQAKRQSTRIQNRKDRAEFIAKYGIAPEKVQDGLTPQEKKGIKRYQRKSRSSGARGKGGLTPYQHNELKRQSGKEIERITSIQRTAGDLFGGNVTVPLVDKNGNQRYAPDGKTKLTTTRKPTAAEVKAELRKKGYDANEIHLALTLRDGNPLTRQDVRTAHQLGVLKVPRGWVDPYGTKKMGGGHGAAPVAKAPGGKRPT